MDIPKGFAKKSEEKLEELLLTKQEAEQDDSIIEIERSGIAESEIEGEEWLEKVANYITELDTGLDLTKENWDYGWSVSITYPPKVTLCKKVIETYEEKNRYLPFIKKIKQREKLKKVITVYMERYNITCSDENYEDLAFKIAKKLGHEKIDTIY